LLEDIVGDWSFRVDNWATGSKKLETCGHAVPNSVKGILQQKNNTAALVGKTPVEYVVTLLDKVADGSPSPKRQGKHMVARDSAGQLGTWTIVFDEGVEIRMGDRTFFTFFSFDLLPGVDMSRANDGDNWEHIGKYHSQNSSTARLAPKGEVYACDCASTVVGWHTHNGLHGCFYGTKVAKKTKRANGPTSIVVVGGTTHTIFGDESEMVKMHWSQFPAQWKREAWQPESNQKTVATLLQLALSQKKPALNLAQANQAFLTKTNGRAMLQTPGATLPDRFDWRDALSDMGQQWDQGACGSCYAFSTTLALQMRFRLQLFKKYAVKYPLELSWRSVVRCNPFAEGCKGGFPYSVGKFLQEVGTPTVGVGCDGSGMEAVNHVCQFDSCFAKNASDQWFYAKDYGYVNGLAQGANEETIKREIYSFGPVAMELQVDGIPGFMTAADGVMDHIQSLTPRDGRANTTHGLNQWHYTNHAVVAIGWGESAAGQKYWIIRNSWTKNWGDNGYAYVTRGNNAAGIETSAIWVDPDLDRIPETLKQLKPVKKSFLQQ